MQGVISVRPSDSTRAMLDALRSGEKMSGFCDRVLRAAAARMLKARLEAALRRGDLSPELDDAVRAAIADGDWKAMVELAERTSA